MKKTFERRKKQKNVRVSMMNLANESRPHTHHIHADTLGNPHSQGSSPPNTQPEASSPDMSVIWESFGSLDVPLIKKIFEFVNPEHQQLMVQIAKAKILSSQTTSPSSPENILPNSVVEAIKEAQREELYSILNVPVLRELLAVEFSFHIPEREAVSHMSNQELRTLLFSLRSLVMHHLQSLPRGISKMFSSFAPWEIVRNTENCFLFFRLVHAYNLIQFVHNLHPQIKLPEMLSIESLAETSEEARQWLLLPFHTQQLKQLTLKNQELTAIPSEIAHCTHLTKLLLEELPLYTLPSTLGSLRKLTILNLTGCPIAFLPHEIGQLSSLRQLILSKTRLKELPQTIGSLKHLEVLDISDTNIASLPESLGNLLALIALNISWTKIDSLPPFLRNASNLEALNVSGLNFTELPDVVFSMKRLENVDISLTRIAQLPENLRSLLPNLRFLNATSTPVEGFIW